MGQFDRQIATAQRLIRKNGMLCEWHIHRDGIGAQPWIPIDETDELKQVYICFLPEDQEGRQTIVSALDIEVADGTTSALMGTVDFEPSKKDFVLLPNGTELRIENIDILAPNGQRILYTIRFKG